MTADSGNQGAGRKLLIHETERCVSVNICEGPLPSQYIGPREKILADFALGEDGTFWVGHMGSEPGWSWGLGWLRALGILTRRVPVEWIREPPLLDGLEIAKGYMRSYVMQWGRESAVTYHTNAEEWCRRIEASKSVTDLIETFLDCS